MTDQVAGQEQDGVPPDYMRQVAVRASAYAQAVAGLVLQAQELVIETSEEYEGAAALLLAFADKRRQVEKAKATDRQPLNRLLGAISDKYDQALTSLQGGEALLDSAVLKYRTEQRRIEAELERKRLEQLQAAQLAAAKAQEAAHAAQVDAQRAADAAVAAGTPDAAYQASDAAVAADEAREDVSVAVQAVQELATPVQLVQKGVRSGLAFQVRWHGAIDRLEAVPPETLRGILGTPEGLALAQSHLSKIATAFKRADAAPAGCRFWAEETTKKGRAAR